MKSKFFLPLLFLAFAYTFSAFAYTSSLTKTSNKLSSNSNRNGGDLVEIICDPCTNACFTSKLTNQINLLQALANSTCEKQTCKIVLYCGGNPTLSFTITETPNCTNQTGNTIINCPPNC